MQRFPFQSWLNYNPLLPASDKWSTPLNSPHHDDFKKVWFVGCLTTARATPTSREGDQVMYYVEQCIVFHVPSFSCHFSCLSGSKLSYLMSSVLMKRRTNPHVPWKQELCKVAGRYRRVKRIIWTGLPI